MAFGAGATVVCFWRLLTEGEEVVDEKHEGIGNF